MTIPNHFPDLPPFKPPIYLKDFASRVGVAVEYLRYLGEILQEGQTAGVRLSSPTVEILEEMLARGYMNAPTDVEESKIEQSIDELKSLFDSSEALRARLKEMRSESFNAAVDEIIATVKAAGWRLVRRHDSAGPVGTSIYLRCTTDGEPPDPDYQWDIRSPPGFYEPFSDDHYGNSAETFQFDPRHCKLRISDHGCGGSDIGVSIVISLESATCKVLGGRHHEFYFGGFERIFDKYVKPKFNPRKKRNQDGRG